ncbi:thiolase family protein [Actinotalea sp. M2MS4P-6]|uniref:thiolase family protein n=1 Tax=Actinotalea sp. M2MS4P-6 TaxID=2983762 RepID=UPI0021E4E771|nr:thiolase family protein [Actinotalea sp. M2MS4P-6]MCV2394308.1 thiolase family protein [Actinotalea sp. M2MS4P-6]
MTDAVIVAYGRSAIAKAGKGSLVRTHPVAFGAEVLRGVLARVPQLDPGDIDDVIVGCALPETTMGLNAARNIVLRAGLPSSVSGQTVTRFCASGLQTIAAASAAIDAGMADVVVAGGVEHMSSPVLSDDERFKDPVLEAETDAYIPMGITAENVARRWGITREEMDAMAVDSHARATAAREAGRFAGQIVPVTAVAEDGSTTTFEIDEGIRPSTSMEGLAGLKPVFAEDGSVTAGTSSQRSDGAAFAVLMSRAKAEEIGATPIARVVGFAVAGVDADVMGIGPIAAVPKVLARTGLGLDDIDVIELNEAFASQSIAVLRELGIDWARVNRNGGGLAMGHPLGATGAVLTCKALAELAETGGRRALVTMCIGGGMGAAGTFELV